MRITSTTLLHRYTFLLIAGLAAAIPALAQHGTIPIGWGPTTSPETPLHSCHAFNYSQQIYTAQEITAGSGVAGDITAIRFFHAAGADDAGTGWNDWTVYMGETSRTNFNSTSDWVPGQELQQVFTGTVQPVTGAWMEITLDTPFPWDGALNLVVAVHENSPGFGCTAVWKAYDAPEARTLLYHSDAADPDPMALPAASAMPSNRLAQVQFIGTTAACVPAFGLNAESITPSSLLLSWTDTGADSYTYEVRTSGAPGSGPAGLFAMDVVPSGSTAIAIQGLLPNTDFFIYVRSQCGATNSQWSYPLVIRTPCEPVATPYTESFHAVTQPALPPCFTTSQVTGQPWATTAAGLPGMSGNCARAVYDMVTLPDQWLFTPAISLQGGTEYRLSYLYGNGSTDGQDELSVYLGTWSAAADMATPLAQHSGIATANALASHVDFTPDSTGTFYIGFRYFAMQGSNPVQMFLDNIQLAPAPTCEPVSALNATAAGPASGSATWTAPATAPAEGYDLYYSTDPAPPNEASTPNFTAIQGLSQTVTGLAEGVPVYMWVRSRCSDADRSAWTGPADFTPGVYQIGSGPGENGAYPISSCRAYSYSQQIYLADEYNGGPYITHIRFKYTGGSSDPSTWAQWTVYMGNTVKTAFYSQADWVPYGQLQQVFSGSVAPTAGEWMDLTLDAPFQWNGTDNIAIAVDENTDGSSCTASWAAFSTENARGLLYASDFLNPGPGNPPSASQSPDFTIAQVQLIAGTPAPCNALPAPGATTGPASICPGISFNLGLETVSPESGISYLWQTSTDGTTWSNAAGNGTGQAYQTSQVSDTWYRALVTCDAAGTTASTALLVTTNPFAACYCQGVAFTAQVEPICNVTFAGIDQDSPGEVGGSPGLEDFTAEPAAEVTAGMNYAITVTGNTNGNSTDRITAFFDWDQDGIFEASVNLSDLTNSNCNAFSSGMVSVPMAALAGTSRMRVVKNASTVPADPCGQYSYGQAEDYTVHVTVPEPCDAMPTPGNTTGPSAVCADVEFTLGMENLSAQAGISFQWESSSDGSTWANVPGAGTEATCTVSQTAPTWYRVQVSCDVAGTAGSTPLLVGMNAPTDCYCNTLSFSYQVQPVCHVGFAGIDNTSSGTPGGAALEDFTADAPGQVTTGFTYPITVSGYSDITTSQVAAFFDWDQDGVFETVVPIGSIADDSCSTVLSATVSVPETAMPGTSRMRILSGDFQVPSDPCGTYISGQGEDYLLQVSTALACDGPPDPGSTDGPSSACPSMPFTLGISNILLETGISYQWQRSPDGTAWTDVPGNSNQSGLTTSIATATWFRAEVECNAGGTGYSTPLHVLLAPPAECYCTSIAFTAMVQPVCHVSFAGLDHASDGNLNGSPDLENFTSFTASVYQGHTYPLSVSGNTGGGTGYVTAFFDWDGDGVFETVANVGTITGGPCTETATVSITVPAAAATGLFHARVVMNAGNYATAPCAQYVQGQAEDYTLEVLSSVGIAELRDEAGIRVFPNPARTELFVETRDGQPVNLEVADMLGQLMLRIEHTKRVDIARLAPGMYLLFVRGQDGHAWGPIRFVKE